MSLDLWANYSEPRAYMFILLQQNLSIGLKKNNTSGCERTLLIRFKMYLFDLLFSFPDKDRGVVPNNPLPPPD